jgi:hypothetical protein
MSGGITSSYLINVGMTKDKQTHDMLRAVWAKTENSTVTFHLTLTLVETR